MEDLKWRIGVLVESSLCKNLNHPYVAISFKVREVDGSLSHHNMELTYDDFMVLSNFPPYYASYHHIF